ncbi:hypothetical protein BDZ89DRAFT_1135743 [Hymenopellis radicata]|nr:hypothetical protein BDZ89DRAFT_1135743 [Hymenopellis radicata]
MAHPLTSNGPPLAVALVFDASLTLAGHWNAVFTYVGLLLKRLAESNPGVKYLLAFVAYGNAETRPTPIIIKRYFHDMFPVTKMLREDCGRMGIGNSGSGRSGMSSLEGIIAALEMFDTLLASLSVPEGSRGPISHMIHATASPVDGAVNPVWNGDSAFDEVTWDTIPEEFKKRHIHFTSINIDQDLPPIIKLHKALDNHVPPWFQVHGNHTLLLSGFTISGKTSVKRPSEAPPDKSPEMKRQRVTQPSESAPPSTTIPPPNPAPAPTPAALPVPAPAPVPPTSTPPQPTPPTVPALPPAFMNMRPMELVDRFRLMEGKMQQLQRLLLDARAKSETQRAAIVEGEINKSRPQYMKMKQLVGQLLTTPSLAALKPQLLARLQGPPGQPPIGMPASSGMPINTGAPSMSAPPPMQPSISLPDTTSLPTFAPPQPMNHARSASGDFGGMNMGMHNPQTHMTSGPSSVPQNVNMMIPPSGNMPPQVNQPPPGSGSDGKIPVWQGPLCWSGVDNNNGKREMQTHVVAVSQNAADFRTHTWPNQLMLTPTSTPAVPMGDLQAWVKKTSPALCMFQPQPQPPPNVDKATNDAHFKSLIALLMSKKVYALAAWTLPSGSRNPGCLIFPIPGSLVGAFFPVDGIPEMPRPPIAMALSPQVEQQLAKMSADERNMFMAQYVARLKAQQAMSNPGGMQAGGMPPGMNGLHFGMPKGNNMNSSLPSYMGAGGMQQQQQQHQPGMSMPPNAGAMNMMNFGLPNMGQPQQAAGLPRPMQPNLGGFSNEIMQSFMTRNGADGQGG